MRNRFTKGIDHEESSSHRASSPGLGGVHIQRLCQEAGPGANDKEGPRSGTRKETGSGTCASTGSGPGDKYDTGTSSRPGHKHDTGTGSHDAGTKDPLTGTARQSMCEPVDTVGF